MTPHAPSLDYDLFRASVSDALLTEGRRRRDLVAIGRYCPCGAGVKPNLWRDRANGLSSLTFSQAVTLHAGDCPALLSQDPTPLPNK